jgi:hypothetical protein
VLLQGNQRREQVSLQRYGVVFDSMYEDSKGEWVRLDDVVELLKTILVGDSQGLAYCYECGYWDDLYPEVIALFKGANK